MTPIRELVSAAVAAAQPGTEVASIQTGPVRLTFGRPNCDILAEFVVRCKPHSDDAATHVWNGAIRATLEDGIPSGALTARLFLRADCADQDEAREVYARKVKRL